MYPDKIRQKAVRIVEQQRCLSASAFSARDHALVNRISANMTVAHMRAFDPQLLVAYSEVQMLLLSARRKSKSDEDRDLPDATYAVVSALKAITGSAGQTIATIRKATTVGIPDKEALALAEELQEAARKIKDILSKVST